MTHGDYLEFVEAGGYRSADHWSAAGWEWCRQRGAEAPRNWTRREDGWWVRFMDRELPLPRELPVSHVCYWEAEAFAAFAGKRLPTEAEWEKAALWDPLAGRARRHPWGDEPPAPRHANLDQLLFEPAPVGAYPDGVSAYGVHQMVGDVWEWTSSDFAAYPGFAAFPYREYSEIFFGDEYKVLRGGSWATRPERRPRHLSQLGLPHPAADLRRLPLRPGRLAEISSRPGWPRAARPLSRRRPLQVPRNPIASRQ